MGDEEILNELWKTIVNEDLQVSGEISDKWLNEVKTAYENRNEIGPLSAKLKHFQTSQSQLKQPPIVFFALIFVGVKSEPASADNVEAGVDKFKEFAQQAGLDEDSIIKPTVELLELAATTNSTDEHKTEGAYGEEDKHYFIDINFSIFASDWEHYEDFMARTRQEYSFLNDDQYKSLRRKILQSFLQIPNIFATKDFRSKYEQLARENIQKEIDILS